MADGDDDSPFGEGLQVEVFHPDTDREPGDTNWRGYGFDIHPQVFIISAVIILSFIAAAMLWPDAINGILNAGGDAIPDFWPLQDGLQTVLGDNFAWLFILAANFFILVVLYFAMSKYGNIRLGGVGAEKEFSDISWIAMLFSAGMGIGLMFFGVAEPIFHFQDPHLGVAAGGAAAGEMAMATSLFHWGFHPWAIYGLVGVSLAFFSFNRGLPLTFRSIFWPLLGERIYGWWGHLIDILTVFATLFGLVTSLGLGAMQINAGLDYMFDIGTSELLQIGIVMAVTAVAVVSVALGLKGGVRRLSNLNLFLMFALMFTIFVLGPSLFILGFIPQGMGAYLGNFFELSFYAGALGAGETYAYEGFLNAWTVFYWAWWIAWSPFVGMFIARISRGRTVREFMLGVLVLPVLFSFMWFGILGGTAINLELGSAGVISELGTDEMMFAMFEQLPGTAILSGVAILLVATFFITSSDSGSLVIDHLTSGGKHDAPVTMRVFWAVTEGLVASALLFAGGENALNGLQAAAISAGLPFTVILIFMAFATYIGLSNEYELLRSEEFAEAVEELSEEGEVVVTEAGGSVVTDIAEADED